MKEKDSTKGVQEEDGKPAEEQASASTEQADNDGVIELDVTKKYRSKRNPDVAIPGDELWAGYGRGRQFDKLQSEHQKLQAQDQAKDERLAQLEERLAELEAKERMVKAMQDLGIGASGQKSVTKNTADDWLTPDDSSEQNPYPAVNPSEIASRAEDVFKSELDSRLDPAKIEQMVNERVAQLYSTEQEKRDAEERRRRAATKIRGAKLAKLKNVYPDISEDSLAEVVATQTEYMGHVLAAADLSRRGDDQAAIETFLDGEEKLEAMLAKQLDFAKQQQTITAERDRQAELEAFSAGTIASKEDEEPEESEYNWHEAEKKRTSRRQRAKELVTRRQQLKNSGMT